MSLTHLSRYPFIILENLEEEMDTVKLTVNRHLASQARTIERSQVGGTSSVTLNLPSVYTTNLTPEDVDLASCCTRMEVWAEQIRA